MAEIIKFGDKQSQEKDGAGRVRKVVIFGNAVAEFGSSVAGSLVHSKSVELDHEQRTRFERYIGSMALVAGNFYERETMYERMNHVADGLENEGMLRPNRPIGIRTLWRSKRPDNEVNQRLLETADVLREVLHERGVVPHVSARPEYPYGGEGTETSRALAALGRSVKGFESLLGVNNTAEEAAPMPGDLGFIAVINSGWSRAFRGVNAGHLLVDDGFVMLNGAGSRADDIKWISPSIRETLSRTYD